MKTHNATSTPAASACQPDAVRTLAAVHSYGRLSCALFVARLHFVSGLVRVLRSISAALRPFGCHAVVAWAVRPYGLWKDYLSAVASDRAMEGMWLDYCAAYERARKAGVSLPQISKKPLSLADLLLKGAAR